MLALPFFLSVFCMFLYTSFLCVYFFLCLTFSFCFFPFSFFIFLTFSPTFPLYTFSRILTFLTFFPLFLSLSISFYVFLSFSLSFPFQSLCLLMYLQILNPIAGPLQEWDTSIQQEHITVTSQQVLPQNKYGPLLSTTVYKNERKRTIFSFKCLQKSDIVTSRTEPGTSFE
uniref:Uncharacterized protein n=1 Tax=Rhipicephalus pulchellus TaxID=72859 RepID=L7LYZ9_RHIPC